MTFTAETAPRVADESLSSVLSGVGRAGGAATRGAEVNALRELIATMILPGAGDTPGSASRQTRAEWVDLLGELEAVKSAVAATQARLAVALAVATKAEEAAQGVRSERRGRGVASQVGAAMRVSPYAGASFLGTARAWLTEMPFTFDALRTGVLSQWRATLLVRETSHLSAEHRAWIDEEVCGPAGLAALAGLGTRRLVARVKALAARLDVDACVRRNARAVSERRVSVRPAPDLMVYVSALVPMQQGVQAYAQLKVHAGVAGPRRGRVSRSRYSSDCQVGHQGGAIPYRHPRGRRRRSGADLSWT